jgi:hypothetical protein
LPAAGTGVTQPEEGDAPGLVPQRGDAANHGNRGQDMIDADGDGDAARSDDGQHGHRERSQALWRYLVGKQQLARELAKREQADGRQQASLAGPRAYPHTFSIWASAADSSRPPQR